MRTAGRRLRVLLGTLRFAWLAALGRLGDRIPRLYELDARLERAALRSARRRDAAAASRGGLDAAERSEFSQNGEDGVIEEVLGRIGAPSRTFVEIGASDGAENCTRALAEQGWSGAWYEGDPDRVELARALDLPGVSVTRAFVDRHNVAELLRDAEVPVEPDLFVLDIDGDDLGVLRTALEHHRPRLVVVEYNAGFPPPLVWALPERSATGWDGTFRFGASLQAFVDLVEGRYRLVHCDRAGVNAFFVRRDLAERVGPLASPRRLHRRAAYSRHPFGHVRSRAALEPMTPPELQPGAIRIEVSRRPSRRVEAGSVLPVDVVLENRTDRTLGSGRPNGFNLVLRWLDEGGGGPRDDAPRTTLPHPVPPGGRRRLVLWMPVPERPGPASVRVTAVLEGVAWLEHLGGPGSVVDLDVEVVPQGSPTPA